MLANMLAIVLLVVSCIYLAASIRLIPKPIIAVKNYVFDGEDPKILSELKQRLAPSPHHVIHGTKDIRNANLPEFLVIEEDVYLNRSLRRQYFNNPKEYTLNFKILDMMRQAIYATQFRLDVLDKSLEKYNNNERFRMAYMFGKVEEWLRDMKGIWTAVSKSTNYTVDTKKRRFRVYKQLLYYAHMVRRDIDITYTVEEMIRIHNEIYISVKSEDRP